MAFVLVCSGTGAPGHSTGLVLHLCQHPNSRCFLAFHCEADEKTTDLVPEKKVKSKVAPLRSILWMLNVPLLHPSETFHGQQGRRPSPES